MLMRGVTGYEFSPRATAEQEVLCQSIRDSTVQSTGVGMGSKACNENSVFFSVEKNMPFFQNLAFKFYFFTLSVILPMGMYFFHF